MMLYVSGPMSGIEEYNFPAFKAATERLRAAGYKVLCPTEVRMDCGCLGALYNCEQKHDWADFVRADLIAMLRHANAVALLPGWDRSSGAKVEVSVALALGMRVRELEGWL